MEPLLLFFIIFFTPGEVSRGSFAEIQRSLLFRLPAFILITRLGGLCPGRRIFVSLVFALSALLLTGFAFSFAARLSGLFPAPGPPAPAGPAAWIAAILSSLSSGFLEEGYFRAYLLAVLRKAGAGTGEAVIVSTLLFGFCHIYEGPWGAANAAAAGLVLSFLFIKYKSFYGIALAHGLYNVSAYIMAALQA